MKVALIHYHLRTGGVTRVLETQSHALTAAGVDHLVFSGSSDCTDSQLPSCCIPELDYLTDSSLTAPNLYAKLLAACHQQWGSGPDVWHLHNPTLGKNVLFPGLIELMAASSASLVLQIHDFAEDNRPQNYPFLASPNIYPLAPQIHYAFINQRDLSLLRAAGIPNKQSHLIPNAIRQEAPMPSPSTGPPHTVLYPVRGIRRKNLGEILLLAALSPPDTRYVISLAPENEQWLTQFQQWLNFAKEHDLPVLFDAIDQVPPAPGQGASYRSWQESATHLVTTSIAEGFGLTFLEPIALGKPLFGRDLPEITSDFHAQNLCPGRLYPTIPIPLSLLDGASLRVQLEEELTSSYLQYGESLHPAEVEDAWDQLTANNVVDFGDLPENFQEEVILHALAEPESYPLKKWLEEVLLEFEPTAQPEQLSPYLPDEASKRLLTLYQTSRHHAPEEPSWLPKEKVLQQYLSPTRFHFLRS